MEKNYHHRALIALLKVPGMGPRLARLLLKRTRVINADDVFRMSPRELSRIDGIGEERAKNIVQFDQWDLVDNVLKSTERVGASVLSLTDEHYPDLLRQTYDPPMILWVKGDPEALNKQAIAIVGTRNPGSYGLSQAEEWSRKLCACGLGINSGLAYGVDSRAHKTAVECGGATVAVLGSGIDWIYPEKNRKLASQIAASGGAVITEHPPGTKPEAVHFPERNRIVSGMSHGVLVVESGVKGGSMITARLALDQNREVFVVPHPLGYLKGEGCNYLIKTGQGKLVQTTEDVTCELSLAVAEAQPGNEPSTAAKNAVRKWEQTEGLNDQEKQLCRALSDGSLHIDQIAEKMETQPHRLSAVLLELEMKGLIEQKAGKYFELR